MSISLPTLRNYKGFTIIEIMISVALLAVIMTLIYQTTFQSIRGKKKVEERDKVFHAARVALEKMSQDISMAFLLKGKEHLGDRQGSPLMKTVFNGSADKLYFTSLSHLRLFEGARESEAAEIGYQLERDPDNREGYHLLRRESPTIDTNPEDGGKWVPLAEGVKKIKFEFYDAKQHDWRSSWNSTSDSEDRLPRAVKVTLTFPRPAKPDEEVPFEMVTLIEMYANPIDF